MIAGMLFMLGTLIKIMDKNIWKYFFIIIAFASLVLYLFFYNNKDDVSRFVATFIFCVVLIISMYITIIQENSTYSSWNIWQRKKTDERNRIESERLENDPVHIATKKRKATIFKTTNEEFFVEKNVCSPCPSPKVVLDGVFRRVNVRVCSPKLKFPYRLIPTVWHTQTKLSLDTVSLLSV